MESVDLGKYAGYVHDRLAEVDTALKREYDEKEQVGRRIESLERIKDELLREIRTVSAVIERVVKRRADGLDI